ncbi:TPA: hypothetical protein KT944_002416, partial [Enterococcus faecium]|nr:hypothetical protein [Enterococcus faecium]
IITIDKEKKLTNLPVEETAIIAETLEHFVDISLHDFEEIYGKETREIEAITLVKTGNFKK